ncbi:hypothetical protein Daus18300_012570 [Diaporthe australafricana]|uniref:Uncharacterized protein n=1 Tax=Diaporthe australafricana TaxID=127596 RepID=A0ABR3W271_9PEZI
MALCLAHMDAETAALTLELLGNDVDEILDKRKGKQRDDAIDDSRTALDVVKADLEATATVNADKAMAQSIARAVHQDCEAISAAQAQEKQAADDRQAALQFDRDGHLNSVRHRRADDAPPPYDAKGGNDFFDKLEAHTKATMTQLKQNRLPGLPVVALPDREAFLRSPNPDSALLA